MIKEEFDGMTDRRHRIDYVLKTWTQAVLCSAASKTLLSTN